MKSSSTLTALTALLAVASALAAPAVDRGGLLADKQGMTLYVYKSDSLGASHCNGHCTRPWPPLEAAAGQKAEGDFSILRRDDGRAQWAYKGQPLYRFTGDGAPGEANGEHAGTAWSTVRLRPIEPEAGGSASDYAY